MNIPSFELFTNNICDGCIPSLTSFIIAAGLIGCVAFWVYKLVTYDWEQYDDDHKDSPF